MNVSYLQQYSDPRSRPWVMGLIVLLVLALLFVPIVEKTPDALAYETFYQAALHWFNGLNPYEAYDGYDYYKLSPTFLLPLMGLSQLPFMFSGVAWQAISILLFSFSMIGLLRVLPLESRLSIGWSLFLPFLLLTDFQLNGTYLQSNTIVVSVMVLGLLAYTRERWVLAAMLLAWVGNMKLYPLVLTLLLFLDMRWRFIGVTLLAHLVLWFVPYLVWGEVRAELLYNSWFDRLLMDKTIEYGEPWGHFFLGLRPFLEMNFGVVMQQGYAIILLLSAAWVAFPALWLRLHRSYFTTHTLLLLLVTALAWILLFSTRTEGPTLVFMAPVYAYALWWVMSIRRDVWRRVGLAILVFTFMLTSLSTSDLFRGTVVHALSWQHNLRTVGLILAFAFTSALLWYEAFISATIMNSSRDMGSEYVT